MGGWTDIVEVAAGAGHTVGLKTDGTLVATDSNNAGQCLIDRWDLDGRIYIAPIIFPLLTD